MRLLRRALFGVGLVLATIAARLPASVPKPTPTPSEPPLATATVLALYGEALATLERPPAVTFDFSVEQLGMRTMEQTHRVYRSGSKERDETISIDGYPLKNPAVRIFRDRGYRYDITALAPKLQSYEFSPSSVARVGDGYAYSFDTKPRTPTSFAVTSVTIDGHSFLPSVLHFHAGGQAARATGRLTYFSSHGYWVVGEATADAKLARGKVAHERIVWSNYRFPESLPSSTFREPPSTELIAPPPEEP